MRDRTWPTAAKLQSWSLTITAHSRGGAGLGGHYRFERGPGARWQGSFTVVPMCTADALEFRAFLHSLRGRSGSFGIDVPSRADAGTDPCHGRTAGKTQYSDCTDYTDGTSYTDLWILSDALAVAASAGDDTLELDSAAGLQAGDTIVAGGQLFRIVSVSGDTLTVRPRVRADISDGAAVARRPINATFRILTDAPIVPLIPGRSRETALEIEEFY